MSNRVKILTKAFQALWANGERPESIAAELGLTAEEMSKMIFGLAAAPSEDGNKRAQGGPHRVLTFVP